MCHEFRDPFLIFVDRMALGQSLGTELPTRSPQAARQISIGSQGTNGREEFGRTIGRDDQAATGCLDLRGGDAVCLGSCYDWIAGGEIRCDLAGYRHPSNTRLFVDQ